MLRLFLWDIAQLSFGMLQNGVSHRCACVKLSIKGGDRTIVGSANIPEKVSHDMGYRSDSIVVSRDVGPLGNCIMCAHASYFHFLVHGMVQWRGCPRQRPHHRNIRLKTFKGISKTILDQKPLLSAAPLLKDAWGMVSIPARDDMRSKNAEESIPVLCKRAMWMI